MLKRLFDIGFSLFALIFSLPIIIITALLIKIEDFTEHIFFLQTRIGKDRIPFKIIKFRTMNSRITHEKEITVDGDPRITKVGKWVRKLKFDELPQFINVLRGDMSIVGPRPEMKFIVKNYNEFELLRLKIKPGLTGTWQVSDTRNAPIHHNLDYDLHQIMYYSFSYNMKQIINTILWATKGF